MIEIVIIVTVAIVNAIGTYLTVKYVQKDPECVSNCCNYTDNHKE